ncbi:MAG: hypothetical protein ABIS47_00320, partial [Acidimicrobiales bacterium]
SAIAAQPDDDYRIVMEFFIDGAVSETWTWSPAMTGYVEQTSDGDTRRLQITWARKAAVVLLDVFCDEADGREPRWVASWADATGRQQNKVLQATNAAHAADEAESFIYRMAYL